MMRFLFKPSLSYAQFACILVTVDIFQSGHWAAATIFLTVSSIVGGILESITEENANA